MTVHMIQVSKIKQQVKSGIISKIAMNGRHINLRSIFTTQKYSLLGTGLRNNITGAILFATSFKELDLIEADLNYLEDKRRLIYKIVRNKHQTEK